MFATETDTSIIMAKSALSTLKFSTDEKEHEAGLAEMMQKSEVGALVPLDLARAFIRDALSNPGGVDSDIAKNFTQSNSPTTGLTFYDLEPGAKWLVPVITPLRNLIPRVSGKGGTQANWKAIVGLNTGNAGFGVSEGNRGVIIQTQTKDYNASYRGYGLDDNSTFEATYAAQGQVDLKAITMLGLLKSTMIQEEKIIIGANSSIALGTTPTPVVSNATTGGTIAAATQSVICVALTYEGLLASSVATGLPSSTTRTLADGSTENFNPGTAQKSANATTTTTTGTSTVTASLPNPVTGAFGYAWFLGAAGSERLAAITSVPTVTLTAPAGGTAQLASAGFATDLSKNSLIFDGLFTQILTPGSGSYVNVLATGSTLTADGIGGVVEIDAALQSFWDNYRLSPDAIWVSSQEQRNVTKKVLSGSTNSAQRFIIDADQGRIKGGDLVTSYLNKFAMDGAVAIPIKLHPNVPPGTIMFTCSQIPYPLSDVSNVLQMKMRQDYYAVEWPRRTRKYEYGIYADGVLQNYFPPAFGMITNITNG